MNDPAPKAGGRGIKQALCLPDGRTGTSRIKALLSTVRQSGILGVLVAVFVAEVAVHSCLLDFEMLRLGHFAQALLDSTVLALSLALFLWWRYLRPLCGAAEREKACSEERLQRSERHFRSLTENALDLVWVLNADGTWRYLSPSTTATLGYKPEELVGNEASELLHPDDKTKVQAAMAEDFQNPGVPRRLQCRVQRRDGSWRVIEGIGKYVVEGFDSPGLVINARDITEQKQAAERLRIMSRAVEQSTSSIIITDSSGNIEYANPRFCELSGYALEEVLGRNPRLLKSGLNPPGTYTELWKTLSAGREWRGELLNRKKNGELFWVFAVISPMREPSGSVTHYVGVQEEITQRKRAEEALRASEKQYQDTVNAMGELIHVVDQDLRLVLLNEACLDWCRRYGVTHVRPGQSLLEAFPFLPREVLDEYQQVLATGNPHTSEMKHRFGDQEVCVEVRRSPIRRDGKVAGVMSVVRDLTGFKQLEAQLLRAQRLESLGRLTSGIAHDLSNVLAPIVISTPLLRARLSDPDGQKLLIAIETSALRGADIVKQLLVFGRGVDAERVALDPADLVKDIVKIVRQTFPKNLRVLSEIPRDLWHVSANATQLHQVLMNLCVNARDAMPHGGTLLLSVENLKLDEGGARTRPEAAPGDYVCLTVTDTGTGIPPEIQDKIFDPFFTTKEPGKGTGLGLSTVLGIAKAHGGFVEVRSRVGEGADFKIYLPATAGPGSSPAVERSSKWPSGNGEGLLVVDDEYAVQESLKSILEQHGYEVLTARDGAEALAVYARERSRIKAVLTDLEMPVMGGMALTRVLKKLDNQTKIIVSTGTGQDADIAGLKALGVEIVLNKPYSGGPLLTALHETLAS